MGGLRNLRAYYWRAVDLVVLGLQLFVGLMSLISQASREDPILNERWINGENNNNNNWFLILFCVLVLVVKMHLEYEWVEWEHLELSVKWDMMSRGWPTGHGVEPTPGSPSRNFLSVADALTDWTIGSHLHSVLFRLYSFKEEDECHVQRQTFFKLNVPLLIFDFWGTF